MTVSRRRFLKKSALATASLAIASRTALPPALPPALPADLPRDDTVVSHPLAEWGGYFWNYCTLHDGSCARHHEQLPSDRASYLWQLRNIDLYKQVWIARTRRTRHSPSTKKQVRKTSCCTILIFTTICAAVKQFTALLNLASRCSSFRVW